MRLYLSIAAVLVLLGLSSAAYAYPHFQFSSDTSRCNMCHYAPAGGGMLTSWGRDEAADTLSRGGNGEALHGLVELPTWLNLGGDLRLAGLAKDNGDIQGTRLLAFPMQADLSMRVQKDGFYVQGIIGLRSQARSSAPPEGSVREEAGALSRVVSREHYLGYKAKGSATSYRAGRFYAPYGLRLPDHTSYTRRYLGFNTLEETYGVSMSQNNRESELHLSGHISDVILGPDDPAYGLTAMHERRSETQALGASARATLDGDDQRALAGMHYKKWLSGPKLLLMAELDGGYQRFADASSYTRFQAAAYAGPVWFPMKGVSANLAYELFDEDVRVKHDERQALTSWISYLPRAHYEVFLLGRAERIGPRNNVAMAMLQLHYYL